MKNIVLITIDTLRKDHCSCYGYSRNTTPFIDKLSKDGVKFEHAFANGPLTPRSFPSILCGCHIFSGKEDNIHSYFLPKNLETIAQKLKISGYHTAAFQAGNPFISSFYGYDRGFDFFEDFLKDNSECAKIEISQKSQNNVRKKIFVRLGQILNHSPPIKNVVSNVYCSYIGFKDYKKCLLQVRKNQMPFIRGNKLNEKLSKWLENYDHKKPVFLWMHYMDVHQPHIPKEDICKCLNIPLYSDKVIAKHWTEISNHRVKNSKQINELKDLYDCEIRYVDNCVEKLFNILEKNSINKENTFFIITSDHGDEFGEHGGLGHEMKLYNEMLSVPLIVSGEGSKNYGIYENSLIELRDIPKIISAEANKDKSIKLSKEYVLSQSLRKGDESWVRLISLQNTEFKMIYDTDCETNNEFYFLDHDPYEKHNLIDDNLYTESKDEFTSFIKNFVKFTDSTNIKQKIKGDIKKIKCTGKI